MKLTLKKSRGFTLIEITLVIIIMGILAAAIAPGLTGVVGRAQADAERAKLKTLKESLLADALENGGFVNPLTSTGGAATGNTPNSFSPVVTNAQYLQAPAFLGLGLPTTSSYNNAQGDNLNNNAVGRYYDNRPSTFLYDVNSTLTRAVAGTPTTFCSNAKTYLSTASCTPTATGPCLCFRKGDGTNNSQLACQVSDSLVPAAMVLVSRGKNHQFEFENLEGCDASGGTPAVPACNAVGDTPRTYEAPTRGVNYSNDTGEYYDDVVESLSVLEVVSACQKRGFN